MLELHGNEGKTYVVISVDSPKISVRKETIKKLIEEEGYPIAAKKRQLKAVKKVTNKVGA